MSAETSERVARLLTFLASPRSSSVPTYVHGAILGAHDSRLRVSSYQPLELKTMNGDDDISDVFAIPDFWKRSTWLDSPSVQLKDHFFALDVHSMYQ